MLINHEEQLRANEGEPNTAISITAAQSNQGRMAQAGNDGESEGQETITEHQEEYDNASSAPGSIGGDHEIKSEKLAFEDKR